ncbi:MAG: phosphatase PAP2 family protein [Chitinophagaceae bacterium]|nr:MAG: phosphatase PAP2 family protein [Chitinophagaceae bacterium]
MRILAILLLMAHAALGQVEPNAGTWKTFVIEVKDYRLPPPPNEKASALELQQVRNAQASATSSSFNDMLFWNAGAPGYRWGQLISSLTPPGLPPIREMALLNVAVYDATIAAWDSKYAFRRQRPVSGVKKNLPMPESPSYPCEYSVAAGAAATILSFAFPAKADSFNMLAQKVCAARILSGVQYPSDVKEGFELGKRIALKIIERAKTDGADIVWNGTVPSAPGLWNGTSPVGAAFGKRKLWLLDSANQFRPGAPPDFAKDMSELKSFRQTQMTRARAYYYATQDEWTDITNRKIFEYNLQNNAPRAARIYAMKSVALYDAFISCWEAKYYYWGIRPDQYDTTFHPTLITPPFPGYPSGHATLSSAVATVLGHFFPGDAKEFNDRARECAESRFEGGIHFRTDNEVGLTMGRKIGEKILSKQNVD